MHRYFCFIVIFALVLTAPLSFTGDVCPDFKPDVEIQRVSTVKKNLPANIRKLAVVVAIINTLPEPVVSKQIPTHNTITDSAEISTFHDRAPPLA